MKDLAVLKSLSWVNSNLFITSKFYDIWPEQVLCIKFEMIFHYPVFRRQVDFLKIQLAYFTHLLSLYSLRKKIGALLFSVSWEGRASRNYSFQRFFVICLLLWELLLKTPGKSVEEKLVIIPKAHGAHFFHHQCPKGQIYQQVNLNKESCLWITLILTEIHSCQIMLLFLWSHNWLTDLNYAHFKRWLTSRCLGGMPKSHPMVRMLWYSFHYIRIRKRFCICQCPAPAVS